MTSTSENPRKSPTTMERQRTEPEQYGSTRTATVDGGEAKLTFQQAVDRIGLGWFQLKMGLVLSLSILGDSVELGLLAILSPILRCQWHLTTGQEAAITTVVFCGALVGALFFGSLADSCGRRKALMLNTTYVCFFGVLSAFSPNYVWILITRGLVGFGVGGSPLVNTMFSEFVPTKHRAMAIILLSTLWAVGGFFVVLLALMVMPSLGWRYLLTFAWTPVLCFLIASVWLPESPRFNLVSGKEHMAMSTLKRIAADNGRPMPCEDLEIPKRSHPDDTGGLRDLFSKELRGLTISLSCVWFVTAGFGLIGIILITTSLLEGSHGCVSSSQQVPSEDDTCFAACKELTTADYRDIALTSLADIPGVAFSLLTAVKLGRPYSLALQMALFAAVAFLLNLCTTRVWLVVLLTLARIFMTGSTKVTGLYTAEVFPTTVRAFANGFCSSVARVGALLTPFVAQVLMAVSVHAALSLYGACALLGALICLLFLPETKGKAMKDVPGEMN